jgi:hypothetical protein
VYLRTVAYCHKTLAALTTPDRHNLEPLTNSKRNSNQACQTSKLLPSIPCIHELVATAGVVEHSSDVIESMKFASGLFDLYAQGLILP